MAIIRARLSAPTRLDFFRDSTVQYKIALIFTENVSLKGWQESGTLNRDCQLYEELCALGHEITFVTYGPAGDEEYLPRGSRIQVLTRPGGLGRKSYARQLAAIHGQALAGVDLIKSHQLRGARHAVRLARRLRKPLIARGGYLISVFARKQHATRSRRWSAWLDEFLSCRLADAICVPGADDRDYLVRRYWANSERIHEFPNSIDTRRFRPMPEIVRSPRRICFVGRLAPQKRPEALIGIAERLGDVELFIIGRGPQEVALKAEAEARGLHAIFAGRVPNDEIPALLNSASVFVMPTTHEGSPKAIYEAMACGLPIVSTDVVGVAPAITHGEEGFKFAPDDIGGMAEAVRRLIEDPALARNMGEKARKRACERYSIEGAVERELKLYREVLGR